MIPRFALWPVRPLADVMICGKAATGVIQRRQRFGWPEFGQSGHFPSTHTPARRRCPDILGIGRSRLLPCRTAELPTGFRFLLVIFVARWQIACRAVRSQGCRVAIIGTLFARALPVRRLVSLLPNTGLDVAATPTGQETVEVAKTDCRSQVSGNDSHAHTRSSPNGSPSSVKT